MEKGSEGRGHVGSAVCVQKREDVCSALSVGKGCHDVLASFAEVVGHSLGLYLAEGGHSCESRDSINEG